MSQLKLAFFLLLLIVNVFAQTIVPSKVDAEKIGIALGGQSKKMAKRTEIDDKLPNCK